MPYARRLVPLTAVTVIVCIAWIVVATTMAPLQIVDGASEGVRSRLTYLHPALAIATLVAFVVGGWFGWRHLRTDKPIDDLRSYVAIHIGQILCVAALLTGMIWAKTAWGAFWDWNEPLIVTFLIIFLLYATYQPMRFSIEDPERQARSASVFAVTAGLFTPVCFGVVRLTTNELHPQPLNDPATGLPGAAGLAFALSVVALLLLFATLWHLEMTHKSTRIRLRKLQRRVEGEDAVPVVSRSSSPVHL